MAKRRIWGLLAVALAAGSVVGDPVTAQGDDVGDAAVVAATTPPCWEDTGFCEADVVVILDIAEVVSIDEREQLVEIDARLGALWIDNRLEHCDETARVYQGDGARDQLKAMWWPELDLVGGIGSRDTAKLAVTVNCGLAIYEERFVARVQQDFGNLNDFPFDRHQLTFTIAPFAQGNDTVNFVPFEWIAAAFDEDVVDEVVADGDEDADERERQDPTSGLRWESDEWSLDKVEFDSAVLINPWFEEATFVDDDLPPNPEFYRDPDDPGTYYGDPTGYAPSATFTVTIDRKPRFYIANVILPLILIVALSWSVFWSNLGGMSLAERLGVSITCLLTVVAFDFLTGDSLPRLSYTTRLDVFYNFSYTFVALTVLVSLISAGQLKRAAVVGAAIDGQLPPPTAEHDPDKASTDDDTAHPRRRRRPTDLTRLDEVSRVVFPLAYGAAVAVSLLGWLSPGQG